MAAYLGAVLGALWLGLLTAISPCPLASNVAAISYVGKRVDRPVLVLSAGLLYTLGRTISYVLVALLVVRGLLSLSAVSMFLQRNFNLLLGPVLVVVGFVLLDVLAWPWTSRGSASFFDGLQRRADSLGVWGAGLLGLAFALAFCPVSAALFFGSLVPLAVQHHSPVVLPTVFGAGTALPVVGLSFLIAFSANRVGRAFNALTVVERWMRRATAVVFLGVGIYYCLVYVFGVL